MNFGQVSFKRFVGRNVKLNVQAVWLLKNTLPNG